MFRLRILGDLPDIVLSFSDKRLIMLAKLLLSIPKPPSEPEPDVLHEVPAVKDDVTLKNRAKMRTIMEAEEVIYCNRNVLLLMYKKSFEHI